MVLANDETHASKCVIQSYSNWDYSSTRVISVELIAEEDQYGEPLVLLDASTCIITN